MTVALAASTAPTRRPSAPSPACMPRRRARTQTAGAGTTVYLPVDITVRKLNDFFRPGFSTFAGCVSIRGTYSPVVAGNRGQVVQSLAQWIAGHPRARPLSPAAAGAPAPFVLSEQAFPDRFHLRRLRSCVSGARHLRRGAVPQRGSDDDDGAVQGCSGCHYVGWLVRSSPEPADKPAGTYRPCHPLGC